MFINLNKDKEEKRKFTKFLSNSLAIAIVVVLAVGLVPSAAFLLTAPIDQSAPVSNAVQLIPRDPYTHHSGSGKSQAPGLCTSGSSFCPMGVVDYGVTSALAKYTYNAKAVEGRL